MFLCQDVKSQKTLFVSQIFPWICNKKEHRGVGKLQEYWHKHNTMLCNNTMQPGFWQRDHWFLGIKTIILVIQCFTDSCQSKILTVISWKWCMVSKIYCSILWKPLNLYFVSWKWNFQMLNNYIVTCMTYVHNSFIQEPCESGHILGTSVQNAHL